MSPEFSGTNRTSWRRRDGSTLTFAYDGLNRMIQKRVPNPVGGPNAGTSANCYSLTSDTNDVCYGYDLRGRATNTRFGALTGQGIANAYDGFDRLTSSTTSMGGVSWMLSYQYDAAGNRTRLTFPDGNYFTYSYDAMSRMTAILQSGSTTVAGFSYNNQGLRSGITGGVATSYGYDAIGRLTSLGHDLSGTAQDVTWGLTAYNAASQLKGQALSANAYAWSGFANATRNYASNGLNQYGSAGTASFTYDANGNLTSDGTTSYAYDRENRLLRATGGSTATLVYDPLGRLFQTTSGSAVTQFLYDGDALVGEYNGSNVVQRRYVHGPGVDEPLIWYEGTALATRRLLRANHQGSIVSIADSAGASLYINSYDPYGVPGSGNQGRFAYTGQIRIPEIGMYYYKARIYSPTLGRFLQTDPVGYEADYNLYVYVGNDPVNLVDPSGECPLWVCKGESDSGIEGNACYTSCASTGSRLPSNGQANNARRGGGRRNVGEAPSGAAGLRSDVIRILDQKLQILAPGTPAGLRNPGSTSETVIESLNSQIAALRKQPLATDTEARRVAGALGYNPIRGERSHGAQIFYNRETRWYISRDIDSHSGGVWKAATSIRDLRSPSDHGLRLGTYNRDLTERIGD